MILLVMVFRRRSALRPVNRIKHVVDSQFGLVGGTPVNTALVASVDAPVLANTAECETGSTVNGIFLSIEVSAINAATLPNVYMMVFKNPGNNLTFPNANVVGSDDNKKYVIHQEMVMLTGLVNSQPRTLFKGVIAIPKHLRRNGPTDRLFVQVFSPGITVNVCLQCHYKEFR